MRTTDKNSERACGSRTEGFSYTASHNCRFQIACLSALLCISLALFCGETASSERPSSIDSSRRFLKRAPEDGNATNVALQGDKAPLTRQRRKDEGFPVAAAADKTTQESRSKSLSTGSGGHGQTMRQLWHTRVAVPGHDGDNSGKQDLERMIELVRSVKFERVKIPIPPVIAEPAQNIEPKESQRPVATSSQPAEEEPKPPTISVHKLQDVNVLPYEPVSDQTLQMLTSLLQQPDVLPDPLGLADILFLSARLKEAAACYQVALGRSSPDDPDTAKDRAWILFQIANCLQSDDSKKAIETYRQLIADYPDSAWTELAKAREKLIEWRQKDFPQIADGKSLVTGAEKP